MFTKESPSQVDVPPIIGRLDMARVEGRLAGSCFPSIIAWIIDVDQRCGNQIHCMEAGNNVELVGYCLGSPFNMIFGNGSS